MDVHQHCQRIAAASGSSFYYAFRLLPAPRRHAITAFYAFCREVDDIADECREASVARQKLAWWRDEIARLYDGAPTHPITQALRPGITDYELPREAFEAVIEGMEMDVRQPGETLRYDDFKQLNLYCHHVAGVVGEVSARIFGLTERATLKYANRQGLAFQLTNILRDVGEDARRNRVYLPSDELARFGVDAADLARARYTPAFAELMAFQCERALRIYDEALALLPAADRRAQRPGLAMAAIYRTLLGEMRDDGFRVLDRRYALTPLRKLWLALKTYYG